MMVDITDKNLSEQFPVYTKAGKIWKNRINWDEALKPGTIISTNFGIFTFVASYKAGKEWYIKLSDGNNYYTMKRNQARRNKKLPKTSIVEKIITLYDANMINTLFESARKMRGNIKQDEVYAESIVWKIDYIVNTYYEYNPDLLPKYRSQIIRCYHPDIGNNLNYSVTRLRHMWDTAIVD